MIQKKIPIRKCIVCGVRKPKAEFMVIIRAPRNEQNRAIRVLNGNEKKEGRGAYICKNEDCVKKARKTRRLERIFKAKIEDQIYDALEKAVIDRE